MLRFYLVLQSRSLKYVKYQKGPMPSGWSKGSNFLVYGSFGVKSVRCGYLTFNQIEAFRRVLVRFFKRQVKIWVRSFPNLPRTRKPVEVRMGKGKGNVSSWIFKVEAGRVLFELSAVGFTETQILRALSVASSKLSVRTKIVSH